MHRSQHDPLVTDENAPQRVLVEAGERQRQKQKTTTDLDPEKRKEEQRKYGIHFDDDYDYLQHLKKPGEEAVAWEYVENPNQAKKRTQTNAKLCLPSSVFASEFEEEVGMLHKAAPQPGPHPEWDPDVVAALDDDFDFDNEENQLEDDFVLKAMEDDGEDLLSEDENEVEMKKVIEEMEECDINSENLNGDDYQCSEEENEFADEEMDRLGPLMRRDRFDDVETGSRFTEYSMSSSVIRRNEQLTLLDDRFERFYATYDEPELGDLSMEEIEGPWHQKHPYLKQCFQIFKKSDKIIEYNKEWDKHRMEKYRYEDEGENAGYEYVEMEVPDPNEKKWDCESILSTYSNIYNHPKLIDEPKRQRSRKVSTTQQDRILIDTKTGLPMGVLNNDNMQLTTKTLAMLAKNSNENHSDGLAPKPLCAKTLASTLSVLSIRPKDETVEEKRERKRLVKDYRNERRIERKANASAFKNEKKRQIAVKLNQKLNQQGTRII